MEDVPVRGDLVDEILAELKVEDPKSVYEVVFTPGHVTVRGFVRDELDQFFTRDGENPVKWARVWPIEFVAKDPPG